ncbi:uncharacterized protein LOC106152078 [Lingula anatina]|uniref:Uncharacterized protein LOC106152078 n=1 Tax=Lingula anatina TaxID=7574 RepID=A0A1S3H7C7_LINAN|nr:uncharacterized protein LOC106152078 [Lingula anatina]|eukprot:XP_013381024.1 uncharacterized protein LOC106152078 [Lingula anatina]
MEIVITVFVLLVTVNTIQSETIPSNSQEYPDGFWFGVQSLNCVLDLKTKRSVVKPDPEFRVPIRYAHRLLYYRGLVFEWGVSEDGHSHGTSPASPDCAVRWEAKPSGRSNCSSDVAKDFAASYKSKFGDYHLITNNCHLFATRLARLLRSADCKSHETAFSRLVNRWLQGLWTAVEEWVTPSEDGHAPVFTNNRPGMRNDEKIYVVE